jgi:hypothetical protein
VTPCSQLTRKGKPCRNKAVEGSDRCVSHLRLIHRTTLTPQVASTILGQLQGGMHLSTVLAANGIARSSFYDWLERGRPDHRRAEDEPFRVFREQVEKARAQGEIALGMTLAAAGRHDPAWAAWLLERQFPERWARASQRQLVDKDEEEKVQPETDPLREVIELANERRKRRSR